MYSAGEVDAGAANAFGPLSQLPRERRARSAPGWGRARCAAACFDRGLNLRARNTVAQPQPVWVIPSRCRHSRSAANPPAAVLVEAVPGPAPVVVWPVALLDLFEAPPHPASQMHASKISTEVIADLYS